jgi:hypothetical protein
MLVHEGVDLSFQRDHRGISRNSRRRQVDEHPKPNSASEEQEGKWLTFQDEE